MERQELDLREIYLALKHCRYILADYPVTLISKMLKAIMETIAFDLDEISKAREEMSHGKE